MDVDPYALLGIPTDASAKEIDRARAYSQRILNGLAPTLGAAELATKGAAIDAAWSLLRDPDLRAELDDSLQSSAAAEGTEGAAGHTGTRTRAVRANPTPGKMCSVCMATPAMTMHFRQRVTRRTVESVSGLFCRTCGIATYRHSTNQTLIRGFWRVRSLPTTIAVVRGNTAERRRINRLGESSDDSLALDPGRPVFLRSGVVAVTISALLLVTTVTQVGDLSGQLTKKNPIGAHLPLG